MASRKLLVYVVDDEKIIATTVAMILEHKGFEARSFTNPLEALAATFVRSPDLVVSDVVMPQLTGIELAIKIQAQCPDCKVLLFSGQAATADMLDVARANGHSFELLAKPVYPTDLLKRIQGMIGVTAALPGGDAIQFA